MQHNTKTGLRRAGAVVGLVAAVAASGAAIGHGSGQGSGGASSDQGGHMTGGGHMMQGRGMMGGSMMQGQGMSGGPMMQGQGMMGGPMMHGQGMMGSGMGMMGGMSPYTAGVLGLSDSQRERIDSIQRERAREHWNLMQELREQRQVLMQLQREPATDPDAVANAHERLSATERKLLRMQAEMHNAVRDVLDQEQRERLDAVHGSGQQQ